MTPERAQVLDDLVRGRAVACLATLEADGAPHASMVPFVLTDDAARIVIHVSRLAAHTGNLMRDPRVSLLVMQAEETGILPQGLPRVTLQGRAEVVARPAPGYRELQADYLRRFPDSADLFTFPDFHLVAIRVESARFVAGFAQAQTLTSEAFRRVLGRPAS